ncbi:inorganic phosphate transporter [Ferrimonas balearica]|uniref:inorganic phosphate transporter n=1 Tax=Ferrimonas balearica TaxID=44012 RepID=UPI001C997963|nr:inorganic phosphate transporter [Ferrimonas balearica]MBY5921533.1 inorganic phosphate transporter [Ferrimonas balearica]MBY5995782.1 inorganic phosphate transporter [Ferrimonas balearica]
MDISIVIFLSSGLFLGWSLGANDAANVFGTAVGSRMIRFTTAAAVCSLMVVLGAVISGAGASHTLGSLGSISAIGGAFTVALTAALTVYLMTKWGLPVSTGQAIVGAIIGWNLFSHTSTDPKVLSKILSTWVLCPIIAFFTAIALYQMTSWIISRLRPGLFALDNWTRFGLLLAGAFGSYALGANNIANVMGVFVPSTPLEQSVWFGLEFSPTMQLFLAGGIAIGVGVFTYSKKVMMTVGNSLIPMTPIAAWVVVMAHSLVLFLFSSQSLSDAVQNLGLPAIPLVPVSSSQAVIGAVVGIGILKGLPIQWRTLGRVVVGWLITPLLSALGSMLILHFVQNIFLVPVV